MEKQKQSPVASVDEPRMEQNLTPDLLDEIGQTDGRVYEIISKTLEFPASFTDKKNRFGQMQKCFAVKLMTNFTDTVWVDEASTMLIQTLVDRNAKLHGRLIVGQRAKKSGNQSIVLQVVGNHNGRTYEVAGKAFTPREKEALDINGHIKLMA